ncbi:MAG: carbohydrate-binding family 9-like protein [Acidobacteria bacterium]|nr:carbohydrate-binding family 9-like protein [Acidobacteriota bacterium]
MNRPNLEVRKITPSNARPWEPPRGASSSALVDSTSGSSVRLRTDLTVFRDNHRLLALFSMEDDELNASIYGRDAPLWREDVVEIFLQPGEAGVYYEFEASPNGSLFDARVVFPGPTRETMSVDVGWDCAGFSSTIRRVFDPAGEGTLEILIGIPFSCLGVSSPRRGETWRANFYRIDRSSRGEMYAAWSPTLRPDPDFHVPARFGTLVFV